MSGPFVIQLTYVSCNVRHTKYWTGSRKFDDHWTGDTINARRYKTRAAAQGMDTKINRYGTKIIDLGVSNG